MQEDIKIPANYPGNQFDILHMIGKGERIYTNEIAPAISIYFLPDYNVVLEIRDQLYRLTGNPPNVKKAARKIKSILEQSVQSANLKLPK